MADLERASVIPRRRSFAARLAHEPTIAIGRMAVLVCVLLAAVGVPASVQATQYNPPWADLIWNHWPASLDPHTLDNSRDHG